MKSSACLTEIVLRLLIASYCHVWRAHAASFCCDFSCAFVVRLAAAPRLGFAGVYVITTVLGPTAAPPNGIVALVPNGTESFASARLVRLRLGREFAISSKSMKMLLSLPTFSIASSVDAVTLFCAAVDPELVSSVFYKSLSLLPSSGLLIQLESGDIINRAISFRCLSRWWSSTSAITVSIWLNSA